MVRKSDLEARVAHCDAYHAPFDDAAVAFYEQLQMGEVPDFDAAFSQVEQAQRGQLLREFYQDLGPAEKLELIARLTGDTAVRSFLTELAEGQAAQDVALLKVKAEVAATGKLEVAHLPADIELRIFMSTVDRFRAAKPSAVQQLTYERRLTARRRRNRTL